VIDVIVLLYRYLQKQNANTTLVVERCRVSYNEVRLPSPIKAPPGMDVIWLRYRCLPKKYEKNHAVMWGVKLDIQFNQASKSSERATGDRCDLVVV
jgi:hypothetical protein